MNTNKQIFKTGKTYKVRLHLNSALEIKFRQMSGIYRLAYNTTMEAQEYAAVCYPRVKTTTIPGSTLIRVVRTCLRSYCEYTKQYDCGIMVAAITRASETYKKHQIKDIVPDYLTSKKTRNFRTISKVKVSNGCIVLPKLGDVRVWEKNYLPEGKTFVGATFTFDGLGWWVSLTDTEAVIEHGQNKGDDLSLDVAKDGSLIVNGKKAYSNIVNARNYQRIFARYKKLVAKRKRQLVANTDYVIGRKIVRESNSFRKNEKSLAKLAIKMSNIKKSYFRKVASELAKTKPNKVHFPSTTSLKYFRHNYLNPTYRKYSSKQFMGMLQNKMRNIGSEVLHDLNLHHAVS